MRSQATFADLHEAIMAVTGWGGGHLWAFLVGGMMGEIPIGPRMEGEEPLEIDGFPVLDAGRIRLARYLGARGDTSCRYLYDFGDGWEWTGRLDVEALRRGFER